MKIQIRDKILETSPNYTDRDVVDISNLGSDAIPRQQREQDAISALKAVFPDFPSEWIAGDRVVLNTYELVPVLVAIQSEMLADSKLQHYQEHASEIAQQVAAGNAAIKSKSEAFHTPIQVHPPQGFQIRTKKEDRRTKLLRELQELNAQDEAALAGYVGDL